jgi:hypothetical protein
VAQQAFSAGSSATNTGSYNLDPNEVYSDGVSIPNGRQTANGQRPILVTRALAYISGYGASRTATIRVGGTLSSPFTVASAGSAQSTGWRTLSRLFTGATTARVEVEANGSFYFGRGSSGVTTKAAGGFTWTGGLAGLIEYVQAPSAPLSPSATPLPAGECTVAWSAPTTDGESAITGYRVQASKTADFSVIEQTLDVAASPRSCTFEGLDQGERYYFRVAARNAVTTAASTTSVWSTTAQADMLSGGSVYDGTGLVPGEVLVYDGTALVAASAVLVWNGTELVPAL